MKIFMYLGLFIAVLAVIGLGVFSMTSPQIPQTTITVAVSPDQAFAAPSPVPNLTKEISPALIAPAAQ